LYNKKIVVWIFISKEVDIKNTQSVASNQRSLKNLNIICLVLIFTIWVLVACSGSTSKEVLQEPGVNIVPQLITSTPEQEIIENQTEAPIAEKPQGADTAVNKENGDKNQNAQEKSSAELSTLPIFDQFIQDIKTGEADKIVGMWVEDVLALRVIYQPTNQPGFVSTIDRVATYFLYPWEHAGNHGLLAHNYLAGRFFFDMGVGDIIQLVFGDGNYMDFEVTEIKEFQALEPNNPYGNFIDLETGQQLTANNVFIEVYMGDFHTTLQTCIAYGGNSEWGRQFTMAPPID